MMLLLHNQLHIDTHNNYNKNVEFLPILVRYHHQYEYSGQNTFYLIHNTFPYIHPLLKVPHFALSHEYHVQIQQTLFDGIRELLSLLESDLKHTIVAFHLPNDLTNTHLIMPHYKWMPLQRQKWSNFHNGKVDVYAYNNYEQNDQAHVLMCMHHLDCFANSTI